jgi:citrate synthase
VSILIGLINVGPMLIDAREAARRLGVKPATLYAYVSRGLLRSTAVAGSRERRYHAEDLERLRAAHRNGRSRAVPPRPFDAHSPVLDSAICLVEAGRLYYRGVDAAVLAQDATLEEVARLLWGADSDVVFSPPPHPLGRWLPGLPPPSASIERAYAALVRLAAEDPGAADLSAAATVRTGRRLVGALAAALTGQSTDGESPIHRQIASAWRVKRSGAELIRRCLVLAADHELNPSTYAARCVASTNATPYAAATAALAALSGPRHGGATSSAEAMLAELVQTPDVAAALTERLRRGETLWAFGHMLYPDGDPRAAAILAALSPAVPPRRAAAIARIAAEAERLVGRKPNIDFALSAVSVALGLPRGAALGLLLVGRSVGWIGHAMEQYAAGALIRPRARYVGILPAQAAPA